MQPIIVVRHNVLLGIASTRDRPWETRCAQPHPFLSICFNQFTKMAW